MCPLSHQGEEQNLFCIKVFDNIIIGPNKSDKYIPSETDWDSLYEQEEEETELDMKNNGSVITHLLSQVMNIRKKILKT